MEEGNGSEHSSSDERERPNTKYRLVGVVVHSGQASGGHYYSYIRCESKTTGNMTPPPSSLARMA